MQGLRFPTLYCPFPTALSPHAEAVHQHTLDWVRELLLVTTDPEYERLCASKFGWLAARAYPNAPLDRLTIVSDWNTWLFCMDDQCDERGIGKRPERLAVLHGKCLEVLSGKRPPAGLNDRPGRIDAALLYALHDLRKRMQAIMPRAWMARFIESAAEYFESAEWEAENRARGIWPDPGTYMRMRPYTGGLYTDIELIELTEGIALPLAVRKHPSVQRLTLITNNVVCWSNDIISLPKERAHDDRHNLVLILSRHYGLSFQAALNRVARLTKAQVQRFLALQQRLPTFGGKADADVQCFVAVLRAWMRGNLDWSYESGRYRPAEGVSSTPCTRASETAQAAPLCAPLAPTG